MDADGLYERTGKYPAINIFDFQHFRQRNLNYMGPTAKAWHDAGGIVGFIWHWSVPIAADLSAKEGFAFYSPTGSQGRPGTLVQVGTPEHRIINENLDTIVSYFQEIPAYHHSLSCCWRQRQLVSLFGMGVCTQCSFGQWRSQP